MGMSIVVGVFPEVFPDEDEGRDEQREEFAAINRVLRAVGLPEHMEPETATGPAPVYIEVGSWACVHYLRRAAAHLALHNTLPDPVEELPKPIPVVAEYFRACKTHPVPTQARPDALAQADPPLEVLKVQTIEGPGFEHLMWHSDCSGYYLPLPFQSVIVLPEGPPWDEWGPWLGSSCTLLQECERLAEVLDYPREMDHEAIRLHPFDPAAAGWRRYAVESFMCQVLIEACRVSIESGCAVVFT